MENNGTTTQTPVKMAYENNNSNIFSKNIYISLIVAIIIGLIVGFLISKFSSKPSVQTITQVVQVTPTPDPRIITDPTQILKSPVFIQWGGSTEGKVIEKGPDFFVLENDGSKLKIFIQNSITGFYNEASKSASGPMQKVNFADLKVGDKVRGGSSY